MSKRPFIKIVAIFSFVVYMLVLLYLLFFSNYRQSVYGVLDYNLIPFKSILRHLRNVEHLHFYMLTNNLFGNIIGFVPFGLFISFLVPTFRNIGRIILISFCFSLTIESVQIVFRTGAFDVDDLILNTVGGMIGYVIFIIIFSRKVNHEYSKERH